MHSSYVINNSFDYFYTLAMWQLKQNFKVLEFLSGGKAPCVIWPIFRSIEEAYGFAEFSYGNQPFGATHTIHEVEITVKPKILDINGGREED